MKPIFYAYMITVLVFSACSSGKSTFERGNYYEAVISSVNRLRRNNDHKKSVETLRQAYPMAVAFYEDRAKTALASSEKFKWTEVVKSYTTINVMHDEIKRCPGALAVIPDPVNYYSKLQEAKQHAAEEHYASGIVALQFGDRQHAKDAYGLFKIANDYVQGYKDVNSYMEAALAAATVKILVEPIPVHTKSVGVSAEFFNDKISEFVHSAPISQFVRFYTRAEAQKLKLNPDHIIQLQFDDFTVGQVSRHEKEIQLSKDSIVMGSYITPSTAQTQNNPAPTPKSNLVAPGAAVVVPKTAPVNVSPVTPVANPEAEKAAREKAERERLEKERIERERLETERLERERVERERMEKDRLERERLEREQLEKERIAKELAEKQRAAQAQADQALVAKLQAEKEAAERAAKEAADKAKAAADQAEKERLERLRLEQEIVRLETARLEKERLERERLERERLEKENSEKELAEKIKAEKEKADREKAAKDKVEKEAAEKAAKDKAEKEQTEKEKAEKEKAEKVKYADPSINSEDTLNVKDPVTVCHIPPGNKTNARTLVINRAALKAHLAHGDIEGGCDAENKEQKGQEGKPQGNDKKEDPKKDKGSDKKGSTQAEKNGNEHAFRFDTGPVLFASASNDPAQFLRYLDLASTDIAGDTNKVYGTVKATLYQFTKTTTSKGVVSFRIIDAKTGALLSAEKLPGEFVWVSEWATFNGDERALSAEQLKLTKLKEKPAPPPQDLFIEFTRPIYDQITTKIREFYKGY